MNHRISDSFKSARNLENIQRHQKLVAGLQERISTGKRINRPSDDPAGAEIVLNLKTSMAEIEQFKRSAAAANQKLVAADDVLAGYTKLLDRTRSLVAQGLSGTASQTAQNALAAELESIRERVLSTANARYGDEYLFGGTRQDAPPFDPVTATPAPTPASAQYVQVEPGANAIPVGITAERVFSDGASNVLTDLNAAITALRGTGNPSADHATLENTMSRLQIYANSASVAQAEIGANMNITELAQERLTADTQSFAERVSGIEDADLAESVVGLADAQRALEATLQATAASRRSLFDYLG